MGLFCFRDASSEHAGAGETRKAGGEDMTMPEQTSRAPAFPDAPPDLGQSEKRSLYETLKANPIVYKTYRQFFLRGKSRFDVLDTFPEFAPASRGSYGMLAPLTIQTIRQFSTSFAELAAKAHALPEPIKVGEFARLRGTGDPDALAALFDRYGSDKTLNRYNVGYAAMLKDRERVTKVMEIGLGTNNRDVVSHMGLTGKPGASLRAFRDFLPNAMVYGADIDDRILFEENRIRTVRIDQTDPASFRAVQDELGDGFDLMIDDGLHSLDANFHSLAFFLDRLKIGGYGVVEDIPPINKRFWQIAALLLRGRFDCTIVECAEAYIFVCRRGAGH
jgi:hypothetical protein